MLAFILMSTLMRVLDSCSLCFSVVLSSLSVAAISLWKKSRKNAGKHKVAHKRFNTVQKGKNITSRDSWNSAKRRRRFWRYKDPTTELRKICRKTTLSLLNAKARHNWLMPCACLALYLALRSLSYQSLTTWADVNPSFYCIFSMSYAWP